MDPVKRNILLIIVGCIGMLLSIILGFYVYKKEELGDYLDLKLIKNLKKSKLKKVESYGTNNITKRNATEDTEFIDSNNLEENNDTELLDQEDTVIL